MIYIIIYLILKKKVYNMFFYINIRLNLTLKFMEYLITNWIKKEIFIISLNVKFI